MILSKLLKQNPIINLKKEKKEVFEKYGK